MTKLRTLALVVALVLGAAAGSTAAATPADVVPPCATEDAPGPCRWDAARQGNGLGRSFTVAADGTLTYDDGRP